MLWQKYSPWASFFRKAAETPVIEKPKAVRVSLQELFDVFLPVAATDDSQVRKNSIHDAIQNVFEWSDAIHENYTFAQGHPPVLDGLKELQELTIRDDFAPETVIQISAETIENLGRDCEILRAMANLLNDQIIPDREDLFPPLRVVTENEMPPIPALPATLGYIDCEQGANLEQRRFQASEPLPHGHHASDIVSTRPAKYVLDDLCHLLDNVSQFTVNAKAALRKQTAPDVAPRVLTRTLFPG